MIKEPKISVIIPVHNGEETISFCLSSLKRSKGSFFEAIVVDDHSDDGSLEIIKRFDCRVLQMPRQSGAAAARNTGARAAGGDILLFIDADTVIGREAFEQIKARFLSDPGLGALMGSYADKTSHTNFTSIYKNLLHHYTHQTSSEKASTFWTGCGAIRNELFRKIDGFDEDYKSASVEDIELGYRLSLHGIPVILAKEIQVIHLKRYTLFSLIKSDLLCRAIPWTKIMLRKKIFKNDLNTKSNNIAGVSVAFMSVLLSGAGIFYAPLLISLPFLALLFVFFNRRFLIFAQKKKGAFFSFKSAGMVYLGSLYSGLGFCLGFLGFIKECRKEKQWKGSDLLY